jgi:hypothetical protein
VQAAMDGQVTMSIEGAMLKLLHPSEELVVPAGAAFEITLKLARSNKLKEPVNLELLVPEEIKGLISFSPMVWPTDKDTLKVKVGTKADAKLEGSWMLNARVTTQFEKHPVVSETDIEVEFLPGKENPSSANPALKK